MVDLSLLMIEGLCVCIFDGDSFFIVLYEGAGKALWVVHC